MTAEFAVAVHALVYLCHRGGTVSSEALAENICTNPARVRKILSRLRAAGLVTSSEGKGSGYRAAPGAEGATLRDILLALGEEPVAVRWRSGSVDRECQISSGMAAVMDGVYGELNELCLRRLGELTVG